VSAVKLFSIDHQFVLLGGVVLNMGCVWKEITELSKKKQDKAVALTLPEEQDSGIRGKVFVFG